MFSKVVIMPEPPITKRNDSLKRRVLTEIYRHCQRRNDFVFDNGLVKDVCKKIGFGNPFDATKIDRRELLPQEFIEQDIALIHVGKGKHQFVKGLGIAFHEFEPINREIVWPYKKSLLNEYNSSEANILSVANNQRILHNFTFGQDREFEDADIARRPKTYFPHRTKADLEYRFGNFGEIVLSGMQIEIDLTIEFEGTIAVFEAKNGKPDNFSVYQLYHPFLYYHKARQRDALRDKVKAILCVYVVRQRVDEKTVLKLWKYTFEEPYNIASIKFLDSLAYHLMGAKGGQT